MRILLVDDETLVRKTMQAQLQSFDRAGTHEIFTAGTLDEALKVLETQVIDLAFLDLSLDDSAEHAGLKLLKEISQCYPSTVAVTVTGHDEVKLIEECLKAGAADYLVKPFDVEMLRQVLRKAPVINRLLRKNQTLKSQAGKYFVKPLELKSKSPAFNALLDKVRKLRGAGQSVLIRGESGSGKEILAQYLWSIEGDESRPFIAVNCGAITASLAESELFGHKKGSFSGATDHRAGKFEAADGGDLFLDELATISLDIQVKLLRALSSGDIYPVGQDTPKKVNCRVIAATNESLEELIAAKTFREDLFFRIKQFSFVIPPLRERKEDILDLATQFLREKNYSDKHLSKSAETLLLSYSWPGNVRELRSAIEVAAVLSDGNEIQAEDLSPHLMATSKPVLPSNVVNQDFDEAVLEGNFYHLVREFEQKLIDTALKKKGSEASAAKYLGVPRSTLGDIRRRLLSAAKR